MLEIANTILTLPSLLEDLPQEEKELFNRIFHIVTSQGGIDIPESMDPWIQRQFGSRDVVEQQKVLRVMNLVTCEDVLYNPIRQSRPIDMRNGISIPEATTSNPTDPLETPTESTPADLFGRIYGKHSVTAANVAKIDGLSGLVVFKNHNPLDFSKEMVEDYLDVGMRWALEAHRYDADAKYFVFLWNCLWRAGASLVHGHAQVVLGRYAHYGKIEHLRRCALAYAQEHEADYFQDVVRVHRSLGLTLDRDDVTILSYITPTKEREILLIAPDLSDNLKGCVYEVLRCFREIMDVTSFNLVLYRPPLGPESEEWRGFPTIVRIVDRGDPSVRTSDMGAMELYACPVVSWDPFQVAAVLKDNIP